MANLPGLPYSRTDRSYARQAPNASVVKMAAGQPSQRGKVPTPGMVAAAIDEMKRRGLKSPQ
jgi:hypothetical protein